MTGHRGEADLEGKAAERGTSADRFPYRRTGATDPERNHTHPSLTPECSQASGRRRQVPTLHAGSHVVGPDRPCTGCGAVYNPSA